MRHGTASMYGAGRCRCDACRAARSRYAKAYRHRARVDTSTRAQAPARPQRVPAGPVLARIDALRAAGWSAAEVAREAGLPERTVQHLTRVRPAGVYRATAVAVLSVPVPDDPGDVVDEVLVERIVHAARAGIVLPTSDTAHRDAAIAALTAAGWTRTQVATAFRLSGTRAAELTREAAS